MSTFSERATAWKSGISAGLNLPGASRLCPYHPGTEMEQLWQRAKSVASQHLRKLKLKLLFATPS